METDYVDDKIIGDGRPGRHTQKLMNALHVRIDEYVKDQYIKANHENATIKE